MSNIFRQAQRLVTEKKCGELNEKEIILINRAIFPLLLLKGYSEISISQGLGDLATLIEEAEGERAS